MDEIIELLIEIRDYLACMDSEISDIKFDCKNIYYAVSDINGKGLCSIKDIVDKLDSIDDRIEELSDELS